MKLTEWDYFYDSCRWVKCLWKILFSMIEKRFSRSYVKSAIKLMFWDFNYFCTLHPSPQFKSKPINLIPYPRYFWEHLIETSRRNLDKTDPCYKFHFNPHITQKSLRILHAKTFFYISRKLWEYQIFFKEVQVHSQMFEYHTKQK